MGSTQSMQQVSVPQSDFFHQREWLAILLWAAAIAVLASLARGAPELRLGGYALGLLAASVSLWFGMWRYEEVTFRRDHVSARPSEIDAEVVVEHRDEIDGWIEGRDLRYTPHAGEIAIAAVVMILALAACAVLALAGVAVMYAALLDVPRWVRIAVLALPTCYAVATVFLLLLGPIASLKYWFVSRRLIERQHLDALRALAMIHASGVVLQPSERPPSGSDP